MRQNAEDQLNDLMFEKKALLSRISVFEATQTGEIAQKDKENSQLRKQKDEAVERSNALEQ